MYTYLLKMVAKKPTSKVTSTGTHQLRCPWKAKFLVYRNRGITLPPISKLTSTSKFSNGFMAETGEEEEDHGGNLVNVVDSGAMRWLLV